MMSDFILNVVETVVSLSEVVGVQLVGGGIDVLVGALW